MSEKDENLKEEEKETCEEENSSSEDKENKEITDADIEEEINYLNQSLNGALSEEDKENIKKIFKYMGLGKKKSKWSIFLMNFRNYFVNYIVYILVYFALFGMMNQAMKYTDNYKVLIFIVTLSFYQVFFKELLKAYLKPGLHLYIGIFIFLGLSIFIIHEFLSLTSLLDFNNTFELVAYYLLGEVITYAIHYYISKHIFERILR